MELADASDKMGEARGQLSASERVNPFGVLDGKGHSWS
jgi:hypothetical protein